METFEIVLDKMAELYATLNDNQKEKFTAIFAGIKDRATLENILDEVQG